MGEKYDLFSIVKKLPFIHNWLLNLPKCYDKHGHV